MSTPKAEFPITARDETDAGFRSAIRGAENFARTLRNTIGPLAGIAGAGMLSSFIKDSITMGDELNKAAIKAGIAGREMSELAYAAKLSDIGITDLSTSLRVMQTNLSNAVKGSKTQREAFEQIGVSLADLRGLRPDRQFELLADRISEIKDPADRARIATDLFGRSGANLLPLFEQGAEGIRKAREEAQRFGAAISDQDLRRLSDADDAIKRLSATVDGFANTLAIGVVRSAEFFGLLEPNELRSLTKEFDDLVKRRKDAYEQMRNLDGKGHTSVFIDSQTEVIQRNLDKIEARMAEINRRRLDIERGVTSTSPWRELTNVATGTARQNVGLDYFTPTATYLTAEGQAITDYIRDIQDAAAATRELREVSDNAIDEGVGDTLEYIKDQLGQVADKSFEVSDSMSEFARSAAQNMQSYFADFLFDPFEGGVRGMAKGFVDSIRRMVAEAAAARIFETLFGGISGAGGGAGGFLGTILGGLFGGGKAEGGPLDQGKWYIAGEHGPEPIWGGGPGAFAMGYPSKSASPPNISVTTHIDARGATTELISVLPEILKRNNQELEAQIITGLRNGRYRT